MAVQSGSSAPVWTSAKLRKGTRTWCDQQRIPLRHSPAPKRFLMRNCIFAGMPPGVIVVEGAQYSGPLITARLVRNSDAKSSRAWQRHPAGRLCSQSIDQAKARSS
jgi:hypothetical protein